MASVWIVHRDARQRAALARLAGMGDRALVGAPSEAAFRDAAPPRVVLLGLTAWAFHVTLDGRSAIAGRASGV